jgi:hypothetical protein
MFYTSDETGKVNIFRGKYLQEFKESDYSLITGCLLGGFKKKNLNEIVELFPNLRVLTIEKTSNLLSMDGVQKLENLSELRIEDCAKLSDLSSLSQCKNIHTFHSELYKANVRVLEYLNKDSLKNLYISGKVSDLKKLVEFNGLNKLSLEGGGCANEQLPEIPPVREFFGLSGFAQLKDLNFLKNLTSEVKIRWWGPKGLPGIPPILAGFEDFK